MVAFRAEGLVNSLTVKSLTLCCIVFVLFVTTAGHRTHPNNDTHGRNFSSNSKNNSNYLNGNLISYETLEDGEMEKLIRFDGLTAKETSIRQPNSPQSGSSMKMRQVTDGVRIIQMIYGQDGTLKDCELVRQRAAVRGFLAAFDAAVKSRGNTVRIPDGSSLPSDAAPWLDFESLRAECKRSKRLLDKIARRKSSRRSSERKASMHRPVNGTSLRRKHRADTYIERSMFLAPGTMWCGHSDAADSVSSLGAFMDTDRCCRNHDLCPLSIGGLQNKYNFFNVWPFTVSHCDCDRRFRACLKMANTNTAHIVGKMFFNYVQTKCFVLKTERVCAKRTWNGKCKKYEYKKQAHLRNNPSF